MGGERMLCVVCVCGGSGLSAIPSHPSQRTLWLNQIKLNYPTQSTPHRPLFNEGTDLALPPTPPSLSFPFIPFHSLHFNR